MLATSLDYHHRHQQQQHMVPEYKPDITLAFLTAFIKGEEYPRYVAPTGSRQKSLLDNVE
jgi:hypothetical protein